jgi:Mn2+/Fe2+ NRAMP family transporter
LIIMTVVTLLLEIFIPYKSYAKFLKYLTFSLLAYIIVVFVVKQDWGNIAHSTFIPNITFNKEYILNIVAILGTTISPYLFFWQTNEEVEEEIEKKKVGINVRKIPIIAKHDIHNMRLDTIAGMVFSNLVMFFIIATTASTLNANHITHIETANQAAEALRPFAGDFTFVLFAAGIIGTGLLAVPVLSGSASYAISETFNLKSGLSRKFKQAHGFYGIITFATLIGLLINFTPIKPFELLYYTAILNGIVAAPLMIIILFITNNKNIMREHVNSKFSNILGWIITLIMIVASLALLVSLFI